MAAEGLIIDDEYCRKMGTYFVQQGRRFDKVIVEYIKILETLRKTAIKEGSVADALDAYIDYAGKLKNQVGSISDLTKKQVNDFVAQVDDADQYVF